MLFVLSGHLSPLINFHNTWYAWRIIPEGNNAVIFNWRLHISADCPLKHQRSCLIAGEEPLKGKRKRKHKRKVHPGTVHEASEIYLCSLFKLGARWGGRSQLTPGQFAPGKETRYSFYRRMRGPHGRSGRVRKNSPLEFDMRTVQPVTSRSTNCAIPAQKPFMQFDI
jgi:hypothetical protein